MSFAAVRHALFTVHMWVGLILGLLLAILGLSGSLLVYDETISDWISPPPRATTAGQPLPLSMITGIARDAATGQGLEVGGMLILCRKRPAMRSWCDSMAFRPWATGRPAMLPPVCKCISIPCQAKCWAAEALPKPVSSLSCTGCMAIS